MSDEHSVIGHPRFSLEEIGRRGQQLYEQSIRAQVETEQNVGKQIVIDIETGEYEIDKDGLAAGYPPQAGGRLLARHPDAALYGARIGYDAVYALGGVLTRTACTGPHEQPPR